MTLPLPDLATKTYKDIINEMVASIPRYSNKWTNYNASDPGITILEFLSWIAEVDLYRINNITKDSYINFLRLVAGASGSEVQELLDGLKEDPYSDNAHLKILKFLNQIEKDFLFTWGDIKGNDNSRFRELLKKRFDVKWAENANIEKVEDGKTIRVSSGDNFLSFEINYNKTEVNLKFDDGRIYDFIAKIENDGLNIYEKEKSIVEIKSAALEFLNSQYRAVTEENFRTLAIEATEMEKNAKVGRAIVRNYPDVRKIEIIIVSDRHDNYEYLIGIVKNYLEPRKLIGTRIIVKEPVYTPIKIHAEIACQFQSEIRKEDVKDNIKKGILRHLDPLIGGYDKKGWTYGRTLTIFEIDRIIEDIEGVDHVKLVTFDDDLKITSKKIDGLINPVHVSIKVIEEEEGN
jgi:hypothetical protein